MYICENLDVFVLTYNRAASLKIMLESLCSQTALGFKIKVLNNASQDNTIETVDEIKRLYPNRNIEILTSPINLGNVGNFKHSQELAENEYTAVFHDDDAIHPQYIETAMKILEKHKDAVMVTGHLDARYNVSNYDWDVLYKAYWIYPKTKGVYLNLLLDRPVFCSNIYKTKVYKKLNYDSQKYGKLHDIPFIFDVSKEGDIVFIIGNCVRWGQSPTQDSNNLKTGPFPNELANICAHYEKLADDSFTSKYLLWQFGAFLFEWSRIKNISLEEFKKEYLLKNLSWKHYGIFEIKSVSKIIRLISKIKRKYYKHKLKHKFLD